MQCRSWWKESDLNNAVDSSAARLAFTILFFSVKFMGWGFCRTWHWDLISNEDLLVRKFDLMQPSFIASRIKQNKVALPVHVWRCLPEAHETPCGSCGGRAKRGGTLHCRGLHSAAPGASALPAEQLLGTQQKGGTLPKRTRAQTRSLSPSLPRQGWWSRQRALPWGHQHRQSTHRAQGAPAAWAHPCVPGGQGQGTPRCHRWYWRGLLKALQGQGGE